MSDQYPDGKMNEDDEGQLRINLFEDQGRLILHFGKPTAWVGMDRATAMEIGQALIDRAKELPLHG